MVYTSFQLLSFSNGWGDVTGPDGEQSGYTFLSSPDEFEQAVEQLVLHAQDRAQAVSEFLAEPD